MEYRYFTVVIFISIILSSSASIPSACPAVYQPVCGINGKTYGNECFLKLAGVPMAYRGECIHDAPCMCPLIYQPVCGENGQTYGNLCMLQCAKIRLAYYGECERCPGNLGPCGNHCSFARCPLFPFAVCMLGCDCNTRFYINGINITRLCRIPIKKLID